MQFFQECLNNLIILFILCFIIVKPGSFPFECIKCVLAEYHPPPSPPTPGKEEGIPPRRGSDGKLRGRKRVSDPAPPLDSDIEVNTWSHSVGN